MHPSIHNSIEQLREAYSESRTAELMKRFDAFWAGQPLERLPFTLRRREILRGGHSNHDELGLFDLEELLQAQLEDRVQKAHLPDDYLPTLIVGNSPYYLSIALGAEWRLAPGEGLSAAPLVQSAEEIASLEVPNFEKIPDNPFSECIRRIDYFLTETEGRFPIVLPDPQGPMSLACQLWKTEELFIAMIESPEAVHQIMRLCTTATIEFFHFLFRTFGRANFIPTHCMSYIYRKPGEGVSISEDMFGVLSPGQLQEFLVPYVNEIAREFGPLVVHSCGDCSRKLDVLMQIEPLAAFHFSQTDIHALGPETLQRVGVLSRNDWESRQQLEDYIRAVQKNGINGWIQVHTLGDEFDQVQNDVDVKPLEDICRFLHYTCHPERSERGTSE